MMKALGAVGVVLLAVGLFLGLAPVSLSGVQGTGGGPMTCGSPWVRDLGQARYWTNYLREHGADAGVAWPDYAGMCRDAYGARTVTGGAAAGLGALALLGVGYLTVGRRRSEKAEALAEVGH